MSCQLPQSLNPGLHRVVTFAVGWILPALFAPGLVGGELPSADRQLSFRGDVYPLLREHCFRCHQGRDSEAGYRLDLRAELLGETNGEPLVVVGNSGKSRLVQLVSGIVPDERMPPKGEGRPLTKAEVALLRDWIDQGLEWDNELLPPRLSDGGHWAFQTVQRPKVPTNTEDDWSRTPVDRFVAARHREQGLVPAKVAGRRVLIRRLYLDLLGLPPTPEAVQQFVQDKSSGAYGRLVDQLLASPRYGERWGRHWLDLARWADSEGFESNHERPYAWRYRDYVIEAFNGDKPYDRFLREQIAGDELLPYSDENLIATGFLASARLSSNEEDRKLQRNSVLVDIVNAAASSVLGLTLECAQCHNHKFDPLTQRDYYALQAYFVKGQINNLTLQDQELWRQYKSAAPPGYDEAVGLRDEIWRNARRLATQKVLESLPAEVQAALGTPEHLRDKHQQELARQGDLKLAVSGGDIRRNIPEEDRKLYDELKKKIDRLAKNGSWDRPQTWGFYSPATSPTSIDVLPMKGFYPLSYEPETLKQTRGYILVRGDVHDRGPEVRPSWPAIFGSDNNQTSNRNSRSSLVDWLVDKSNPLTARVWVNRVWQHHFGRGIVETSSDFGMNGAQPSHAKLLDYLAAELMESGWSTKHIHRLILLSSTYRQSAIAGDMSTKADPENRWLSRWSPRRLEAEALRDSVLTISGQLDLRVAGAGDSDLDSSRRRSVYLRHKRYELPEVVRLFDGPTADASCAQRHVSTVALQPLYFLNSPFMYEQAKAFANRVTSEVGENVEQRIGRSFSLALGRLPDADEFDVATQYVNEQDIIHFCHALLNLSELAYIE